MQQQTNYLSQLEKQEIKIMWVIHSDWTKSDGRIYELTERLMVWLTDWRKWLGWLTEMFMEASIWKLGLMTKSINSDSIHFLSKTELNVERCFVWCSLSETFFRDFRFWSHIRGNGFLGGSNRSKFTQNFSQKFGVSILILFYLYFNCICILSCQWT